MASLFNFFFPKKMVGIDIGTSAIKVVEISRFGDGKTLENYGEIKAEHISKEPLLNVSRGGNLLSLESITIALRGILEEAKIKTKPVVFSIPDFFTFCTSFEIPRMPEREIAQAIRYAAAQHITLPVSEVTLDWKILPVRPGEDKAPMKVFLVAVPNQVIEEYQHVALASGLQMYALEAEALGIARALTSNNKKTICLIDIGAQSSTVNIIDGGFLQKSYSFNFYAGQLVRAVSLALNIGQKEAGEITGGEGIISARPGVAQALLPTIDPLLREIKTICAEFYQTEQKNVEEIYLTGGVASLPGLKEYLGEILKKPILVPNCFSNLLYPPILEESLKQMGSEFSVAVGAALGGLETK